MRRTFGMIALVTALGGGQACLAQSLDQQQLQQQQDRQQRDIEEQRLAPNDNPRREEYRTMANEARRHAEQATDTASKAKWLKMAATWDGLAR